MVRSNDYCSGCGEYTGPGGLCGICDSNDAFIDRVSARLRADREARKDIHWDLRTWDAYVASREKADAEQARRQPTTGHPHEPAQ